jgi:hypothetical protein
MGCYIASSKKNYAEM